MTDLHPQPGTLLAGRYRLLRVIGEGGMGVVFEAEHTLTEKKVALKWLHARLANNPEARRRLVREALATCRVSHPNVVEIHDVVEDGEAVFLVLELLQGESLEELLKRGDTPLHQLIALLLPAMRGVAEAHRQGVIHRDIHPANVFLSRRPHELRAVPKVLDFGISKLGGDESPSLTRVGTTLGTPHYMSYEQLCNAREVDERTDVYSFAVILYRAATGRPPFEGASFTELAIKIGSATPTPPKAVRADIPSSLERLILWAMSRDREQRIESMDVFIRELEPFASEHSFFGQMSEFDRSVPLAVTSPALPSVPAPAGAAQLPRASSPRVRRAGAVLLALTCFALAGVGLWPSPRVHQLASPVARRAATVPMLPETGALGEPADTAHDAIPSGLEDDALAKRDAGQEQTARAEPAVDSGSTRAMAKAQRRPVAAAETTRGPDVATSSRPLEEINSRRYRAGRLRRADLKVGE